MAVRPDLDKNGKQKIDKYRGTGQPVWLIDYYPAGAKGKRKRFRFPGKEGSAQHLYLKLRAGKHHRIPVDAKVANLFPGWLKFSKNNKSKRTYGDILTTLRVLVPFFGDLQVDALTQDVIEDYKAKRLSDKNLRRPGRYYHPRSYINSSRRLIKSTSCLLCRQSCQARQKQKTP